MSQFLCIVKLGYAPLTDDNEECVPGNFGAIRHGLEALQCEDAKDRVRAKQSWIDAKEALIEESEDDTGAGATGHIQVEDDFGLSHLGDKCGGLYG